MARMRCSLVAAAATIAALAAPTTASAALVTDCDDLQTALDTQSVVTLAEGLTCHGGFDLPSNPILLEGGGNGATLDGDGEDQILTGANVGATTIRNLDFVDGDASEEDGGAIEITGNSPVTLENNGFFSNSADGFGGAVYISNFQVLTLAARGEEIEPIVLRGNTFGGPDDGNDADAEGGGAYIGASFRPVILDDNTFEDNVAGGSGGGASVLTCAAEVTANVFDGNRIDVEDTSLEGGGLNLDGSLCGRVENVRGGSEPSVVQGDNLFVDNEIRGRFSSGRGGGEYVQGLTVLSTSDSFVGNSIAGTDNGSGGGLAYSGNGGTPFAARNLVAAGNVIDLTQEAPPSRGLSNDRAYGGGLSLIGEGSEFRIEDSTIEGNSAAQGSGIAGNPFAQQGDELRGADAAARLVLHNSIVFGNEDAVDGEIALFTDLEVRSSDACVEGAPHPDPDNSNLCVNPQLADPDTDGDVDQAASSPTRDAGDRSLVDPDLASDYAGDARVLNGKVDIGADEFKAATVEPKPTVQTPAQTPAAQPAPQGAVQGVQQRSCRSKRAFRIRIRVPKGKKALSATVRVNNKKVKVVRGKRLRAPVRLRGLPKGRFKVKITIRLKNGKRITGTRTYHTCIPRLPGDGPPKV